MLKEKLAPNAMTTLAVVKELLDIQPADTEGLEPAESEAVLAAAQVADNNLIRLINAASTWVETQTGRKLAIAQYTEHRQGTGAQELVLQQWPVVSVERVTDTMNGEPVTDFEYQTDDGETGVLYRDVGWGLRGYRGGLAGDMTSARRYIEVVYTAGYVLPWQAEEDGVPCTFPQDLQAVVWGIVEQEFFIKRNGAQGLSAFSISDVSWTFDKEPRPSWLETISRYKRW